MKLKPDCNEETMHNKLKPDCNQETMHNKLKPDCNQETMPNSFKEQPQVVNKIKEIHVRPIAPTPLPPTKIPFFAFILRHSFLVHGSFISHYLHNINIERKV